MRSKGLLFSAVLGVAWIIFGQTLPLDGFSLSQSSKLLMVPNGLQLLEVTQAQRTSFMALKAEGL